MEISFHDTTVLVTGSSRGIGAAIARAFADSGANVVIHYTSAEKEAEALLRELRPGKHITVRADLKDPSRVKELFAKVITRFGKIDILVNNAGIYEETKWWELHYDEWQEHWRRTIDTNLTGMANLSFLVARQMIGQGGGKIINISSRGAFRGEPHALPYGAAKAAMNSFGQSMAWALADRNIQVYTLAPGWVDTDMTHEILQTDRGSAVKAQSPMNRVARPEEIAYAVILLASRGTEFMSGCIVDMNGVSYLRS
jgi:NAD(P)-dependent dehydrogenase (short-subunit alcohol dehydrogenase family)